MVSYGKFGLGVLGVTTLLAASGCELQKCEGDDGKSALCVKSLKRYEADAIAPDALAYTAGTDVSVDGVYGDIHVVEGDSGFVRVKFEPFDYRAYDAESAAREELASKLDTGFSLTDTGFVAQVGRHDSTNGLGADITLYLPPEFDGKLAAVNHSDGPVNPGDLKLDFVAGASYLTLSTKHLGDCTARGAPSVGGFRARCDGNIDVSDVSGVGTIDATGLDGNVTLSLAEIAAGGNISTEDGDITLTFPADGKFYVSALASDGGTVNAPLLEESCSLAGTSVKADNSKSFFCGGEDPPGPTFSLIAGARAGTSTISLGF